MGLLLALGTLAAAGVTGAGLRLLFAARAGEGALTPPAALVLGGVAGVAVGLAFTPFALTGALPTALGATMVALVAVVLASAIAAWAFLRRGS